MARAMVEARLGRVPVVDLDVVLDRRAVYIGDGARGRGIGANPGRAVWDDADLELVVVALARALALSLTLVLGGAGAPVKAPLVRWKRRLRHALRTRRRRWPWEQRSSSPVWLGFPRYLRYELQPSIDPSPVPDRCEIRRRSTGRGHGSDASRSRFDGSLHLSSRDRGCKDEERGGWAGSSSNRQARILISRLRAGQTSKAKRRDSVVHATRLRWNERREQTRQVDTESVCKNEKDKKKNKKKSHREREAETKGQRARKTDSRRKG